MPKLTDKNRLSFVNPLLASEWDHIKNSPLTPEDVSFGCNKHVYWTCANNPGHSWKAQIASRHHGSGCPLCDGIMPSKENNLGNRPEIAKEWNYLKNVGSPQDYTLGCSKKVWWKCRHGHEWQTRIDTRTINNSSCPYCSGRYLSEQNRLSNHPSLIQEWDYSKNIYSIGAVNRRF